MQLGFKIKITHLIIVALAIALLLCYCTDMGCDGCTDEETSDTTYVTVKDTIPKTDTITRQGDTDTDTVYHAYRVVKNDTTFDTIDIKTACDSVRIYKDTIQDSLATIYWRGRTLGKLLDHSTSYTLHERAFEREERVIHQREIKYNHGLYTGLSVNSYTKGAYIDLFYQRRRWLFGLQWNATGYLENKDRLEFQLGVQYQIIEF